MRQLSKPHVTNIAGITCLNDTIYILMLSPAVNKDTLDLRQQPFETGSKWCILTGNEPNLYPLEL